ncbi:ABC transporter substrate-binding protein [Leucobacter sp. Psy1]|uniref:TRAP transporter substrate-binding protein n=1 Tax=Leucobacter sp. Psy1 TaxID=2875729 RepID=UPI001CD7F35E|nr:TRAP transporter substrate-binding protein DctP [Leucobacter sp. Psy1]UBH05697.1 ABC transporter substrate-binding protein [Leucobacter sp. Psy1]
MTLHSRSRRRTYAATAGVAVAGLMLAGCADGGGTAGGDEDYVLTFASWATPGSSNEAIQEEWIRMIEEATDGRITFDVSGAGALCAADEIPECVRDGRADVGQTISDYAPQLFPQTTVVSIPFITQNADATHETLYALSTEHEGAAQLWEQNNLKMLGHWPAGRLLLGSDEPVTSIDDVADLRWRMAGPYMQAAVDTIGAGNVALTAPETYEAVERGVVDAVAFPMDGLVSYQLKDILPQWTDPGIGQYTTVGQWMNLDVFNGLPDDLQQAVQSVNDEFNSGPAMDVFREVTTEQCDTILETIDGIDEWDPAATDEWEAAVGDDLQKKWIDDATANGLEDAAGYLEMYQDELAAFDESVVEDPSLTCAGRS